MFNQLTAGVLNNGGFLAYATVSTAPPGELGALTLGRVIDKLRGDLGPTIIQSCMFWVPAHAVNFKFVPPAFRCAPVHAAPQQPSCYEVDDWALACVQRLVLERRPGRLDGVPVIHW